MKAAFVEAVIFARDAVTGVALFSLPWVLAAYGVLKG